MDTIRTSLAIAHRLFRVLDVTVANSADKIAAVGIVREALLQGTELTESLNELASSVVTSPSPDTLRTQTD